MQEAAVTWYIAHVEQLFGVEELMKPNNPALQNVYVAILTAGNELKVAFGTSYTNARGVEDTRMHWMTTETCIDEVCELYAKLVGYVKAFGGHAFFGFATELWTSFGRWRHPHLICRNGRLAEETDRECRFHDGQLSGH